MQVVDTLDTLLIMGLNDEYQKCLLWISESLVFGTQEVLFFFSNQLFFTFVFACSTKFSLSSLLLPACLPAPFCPPPLTSHLFTLAPPSVVGCSREL